MSELTKRGVNRTQEAIVADIDERIQKHEKQLTEAQEKANKTIAYHKACVESLRVKRDDVLNRKDRSSPAAELLKKVKASGKTFDEIIAMIDSLA